MERSLQVRKENLDPEGLWLLVLDLGDKTQVSYYSAAVELVLT